MTIVGVQLIDRVGRRRLLLIGAIGMCLCEFIVAIVGVTAGHINPVTQAVNKPAQKVLIAFVCMCVFFCFCFSFSFF
jgi:MFS transporter, SP family, sugar:H+ symporter